MDQQVSGTRKSEDLYLVELSRRLQEFHAHRIGDFHLVAGFHQGAIVPDAKDRDVPRSLSRNKQPATVRGDANVAGNLYLCRDGLNSLYPACLLYTSDAADE